jgi:hypothetical protein
LGFWIALTGQTQPVIITTYSEVVFDVMFILLSAGPEKLVVVY